MQKKKNNRYLLIGGGEASRELLSDMKINASHLEVVGILDDNFQNKNQFSFDVPVLGKIKTLKKVIKEKKVNIVIICIEKISKATLHEIIDDFIPGSCSLKIIPSVYENIKRKITFDMVRNLSAEDLIGRTDIEIDDGLIEKELVRKTIFISGAGGTIGSAICQQLLNYPIKEIICFSRGEYSLYSLKEFLETKNQFKVKISYYLGDVCDLDRLNEILKKKKPDWIFHAAAHKHVFFMEENEKEAIKNNVFGTDNMLRASLDNKVSQFVFISTDKAVNPKNIMGYSKKLGECLVHYYQSLGLSASVVRFGNVIGSRGSVVPLFNKQLNSGGKITVTHPQVERYFMTIPESANLVIYAASMSLMYNQEHEGKKEQEKTFILDMGKPVKIDELVRRLIKVYGYRVNEDIEIVYTGLLNGEKINEQLYSRKDNLEATLNQKIFRVKEKKNDWKTIYHNIQSLKKIINKISSTEARKWLKNKYWLNPKFSITNFLKFKNKKTVIKKSLK